jgi:hypothetical protein
MTEIILPRRDSEGKYYISYSQLTSFKSLKSFNLGIEGKLEYIRSYFFGEQFPDAGWAEFGAEVEDYICHIDREYNLTDKEKATLNQIEPLGVFQQEIKIPLFENVYLLGYIDDASSGFKKIRDYKTASQNSKKRYYEPDYIQLPLYAEGVKVITGEYPKEAEVCIIERKGNVFGMENRRDLLSVGEQVWYHPIDISPARIQGVLMQAKATVFEVSELYKTFLKINK